MGSNFRRILLFQHKNRQESLHRPLWMGEAYKYNSEQALLLLPSGKDILETRRRIHVLRLPLRQIIMAGRANLQLVERTQQSAGVPESSTLLSMTLTPAADIAFLRSMYETERQADFDCAAYAAFTGAAYIDFSGLIHIF